MNSNSKCTKKLLGISDLYPELTPAEQEKAEYFLRRYLDLIRRIYERVEREKQQAKEQLNCSSATDENLTD